MKANNLANTSYPSFVEFYTLNEAATAKVKQISSFTADQYTPSSIEGWSTVTINVSTPQRIGIRAQNVYLDNFSATSAEIVKNKKLTITGLTPVTGSTPYYVNQKADGSVDIELSVKLKNTGDVDLIAGETENFTLSPVKKEYYSSTVTEFNEITFDIPVDIPVGEEKTITMTATISMGCRESVRRGALNIPGYRPAGVYRAGSAQPASVNMEGYMPGRRRHLRHR